MTKDKPLKDCFLCCICHDAAGFLSNATHINVGDSDIKNDIKVPLLCKRCKAALERFSESQPHGVLGLLAWASKRSRIAEHKRMSDKVNLLTWECDKQQRRADNLNRLIESKEILSEKQ